MEQLTLVVSCIFLIWGICRMSQLEEKMINRPMMIMHILAYLVVIIIDSLQFTIDDKSSEAFEIYTICLLAVYTLATIILGLIVIKLVTEIQGIKSFEGSLAISLMNATKRQRSPGL